jgi:hypothetical protein
LTKARTAACLLAASLALALPADAAAQFEEPCELRCIGVLGTTGFLTATGVSVAWGRITGGMSSVNEGVLTWGGTFVAFVGTGMALSGNGERQERAVYASGIGTAVGALTGLTVEAVRTNGDEPRLFAGTLMGAAAGAIIGGVYGALTYEDDEGGAVPLMSISVRF